MQIILATALAVTGCLSVIAAVPQLLQLLKIKHSDGFSLISWSTWLMYQVVAVLYTMSIKAWVYFVINLLWVAFYTTMVYLIIKYHVKSKRKARVKRKK